MTERFHFHFSLSCIGEGNGSPLQCSCLENPRDGGAWWAAIYGVAQSQTWLKRLSSSSSNTAEDGEERKEQSIPCRKTIAGTEIFGMAVIKCEERVTWDLLPDLEGHWIKLRFYFRKVKLLSWGQLGQLRGLITSLLHFISKLELLLNDLITLLG